MTKEEVLEKLKFDLELRNRSADTIHDYAMHVRMYQDITNTKSEFCRKSLMNEGSGELRCRRHFFLC